MAASWIGQLNSLGRGDHRPRCQVQRGSRCEAGAVPQLWLGLRWNRECRLGSQKTRHCRTLKTLARKGIGDQLSWTGALSSLCLGAYLPWFGRVMTPISPSGERAQLPGV